MIRLIRFLVTGFWEPEEWEVIETRELETSHGDTGVRYILQSKRTGMVMKKDLV